MITTSALASDISLVLVTIDCYAPIEGASTLDDIKVQNFRTDEDPAWGCNSYCCGDLFDNAADAETYIRDIDFARSAVLQASIDAARQRLTDAQNQEIEALREQHEREQHSLTGRLMTWVEKMDPKSFYLDWEEREKLGLVERDGGREIPGYSAACGYHD